MFGRFPEESTPFADLPAALVEEVLGQTVAAGDHLLDRFRQIREDRDRFRHALEDRGLLRHESSLGYPALPTTCATDGAYAIERLLTADLAVVAAVAVEGLTPPSEKRYWAQPQHLAFMAAEAHHRQTATILRGMMLGNELLLADQAPHDLVLLDGPLSQPVVQLSLSLHQAGETPGLRCSQEFLTRCSAYFEAYRAALRAERSDRNVVALPKYSTRREIGCAIGWPGEGDDRGLLTLLLRAGELTDPVPLQEPRGELRLATHALQTDERARAEKLAAEILALVGRIRVLYYRPHDWLPALRIELPAEIATNTHRLGTVIQGLKHQCATASMLEPFPLYLADRMVKALAHAVPAFRQVTTQQISERYDGDVTEVFFAMHGYRSEVGR